MTHPLTDTLDILVVDDDPLVRQTLANILHGQTHSLTLVESGDAAIRELEDSVYDMAFLDLRLGDQSGLDLISTFLERSPWLKIAVMTAHATVETAVKAMRRGAVDYLSKPFSPAQVRIIVGKVAAMRQLERRVATLEDDVGRMTPAPSLGSDNPKMKQVLDLAQQTANSDATILIRGESGTGKGVLARAIHAWSARKDGVFSVVSCPSLSADLLESELFGHVRGAFTGAVANKLGRIAITDGGTLFLDEIGDLPLAIQPKLLRFLQDREYERVGDAKTRQADIRVVAATNQALDQQMADGEFREDLYFRLNVITLTIPPLRERPEDIQGLADGFLRFYAAKYKKDILGYDEQSVDFISRNPWVGNVRELQNAVERAVILCGGSELGRELFPSEDDVSHARPAGSMALPARGDLYSLEEMEAQYIRHVLDATDSVEEASEVLDVAPSTLWRRRRKYGI